MPSSPPIPTYGRPSKLTPEIQNRICEALRAGNSRPVAAKFVDIPYTTLKKWLSRGRKDPESIYGPFVSALEKAEADAVVRNVAIIQKAAQETWQAAAWWLERKFPETWSRDNVRIKELERIVSRLEKELGQYQSTVETSKETQGEFA